MLETMKELAGQGVLVHVDGLGRVGIPKAIRERSGLFPGSQLLCNGTTGLIILSPYRPEDDLRAHVESLDVQLSKMSCDDNVPRGMLAEMAQLTSQMRDLANKIAADRKARAEEADEASRAKASRKGRNSSGEQGNCSRPRV